METDLNIARLAVADGGQKVEFVPDEKEKAIDLLLKISFDTRERIEEVIKEACKFETDLLYREFQWRNKEALATIEEMAELDPVGAYSNFCETRKSVFVSKNEENGGIIVHVREG